MVHVWNDENDYTQGGTFREDGHVRARWQWDADTRILMVRAAHVSRPCDLSDFDAGWLTDDELRTRLPELAETTAIALRAE